MQNGITICISVRKYNDLSHIRIIMVEQVAKCRAGVFGGEKKLEQRRSGNKTDESKYKL